MSWGLFLTGIVIIVVAAGATLVLDDETTALNEQPLQIEQRLPEVQEVAEEEPTEAPVTNRENCDEIRGTQYLSPEERTWFLDNCV